VGAGRGRVGDFFGVSDGGEGARADGAALATATAEGTADGAADATARTGTTAGIGELAVAAARLALAGGSEVTALAAPSGFDPWRIPTAMALPAANARSTALPARIHMGLLVFNGASR
jgi:hypothetical protein